MKRCFGYVRVSTLKQGEGVSLDAQRDAIEAYAKRNDLTITRWFEEKVTAAKGRRPAFSIMMQQLRSGAAEGLVVHKIDRSARNFADWAKIGDLADSGIAVHFATETLDFRSRGGRLAADIQAVIAADYIRNLRDEVLKGMYGRLKQGLYPWPAPIGYVDCGKGKVKAIDPQRAPLVQQLFELYASGAYSIRSLGPEMARRGLRNTAGRPITKAGVERMLGNPFYAGIIKVRSTGEVFQAHHQPIIDMQLFDRTQRLRENRSVKKVTRHRHLYAGLLRCEGCASVVTGERQKAIIYYRCHSPGCAVKTTREDAIDNAVQGALQVSLSEQNQELVRLHLSDWLSYERKAAPALADAEVQKLEQRLARLTDLFIDGKVDEETYASKKEEILAQRIRLREEVARRSQRLSNDDLQKFLELATNLTQLYENASRDEKRQIVELATSNRLATTKSPLIEPHNWLQSTQICLDVLSGAPHRSTIRRSGKHMPTSPKVEKAIKGFIDAAANVNVRSLQQLVKARETPRLYGFQAATGSPTGSRPRTSHTEGEELREAA